MALPSSTEALPLDLLLRVVETTVASQPSAALVLRNVCTVWRTFVDSSAACHRHIEFACDLWIGSDNEMRTLRRMAHECRLSMRLARSALLDLRICVDLGSFGWDPAHICVQDVLNEIDGLCTMAAPRTRSLEIVGSRHIIVPLFNHSWPFLNDISFQLYGDPSGLIQGLVLVAPRVTRISTSFIYFLFDLQVLHPPFAHQISTLELFADRDPGPAEATLSTFLFILSSFPGLIRLRTALEDIVVAPSPALSPFRHPSLRELHLSSSCPPTETGYMPAWVLSTVWSFFDAPALTELRVPQRWFIMGAQVELGDLFSRNGRGPSLLLFSECSARTMDLWQSRHQGFWEDVIVMVRRMDVSRPV
ncbi:hypothetical protein K438DRAFT_1974673 [Mycena galopus ATCC 62051]|nr:hypothetical protein K438DRAFT_1974673 [Mycena galopus ATCC 62051]